MSSAAALDLHAELAIARRAVRAAAAVSRAVHDSLVGAAVLQKDDRSPVTVADFAAQAVVYATLSERSRVTAMVGEESAAELRAESAAAILAQVVEQVQRVRGPEVDAARVLAWIDGGASEPAASGPFWTLDPIDGTKGFLRGEHYAIALALICEGKVLLGALACPRLDAPDGSQGVLMTAIRGGGTVASALFADEDAPTSPVRVRAGGAARFCESVEASHSDHALSARIAARLGIVGEPVRLDSQAKYAIVARGDASIYLRLPTRRDYREKIWDHAAGLILVEEAGGQVTDARGAPLDFARGRRLEANVGVIATDGQVHRQVVEAVVEALGPRLAQAEE